MGSNGINPFLARIVTHLKSCLGNVTHNFNWWQLLILVWFETKHLQILMFKHSFRYQWEWFSLLIKRFKNDHSLAWSLKGQVTSHLYTIFINPLTAGAAYIRVLILY